ncbi:hypothetical protein CATMIT_01656, partial [Catenibacterium mitsuokai DSM 15897]
GRAEHGHRALVDEGQHDLAVDAAVFLAALQRRALGLAFVAEQILRIADPELQRLLIERERTIAVVDRRRRAAASSAAPVLIVRPGDALGLAARADGVGDHALGAGVGGGSKEAAYQS